MQIMMQAEFEEMKNVMLAQARNDLRFELMDEIREILKEEVKQEIKEVEGSWRGRRFFGA